MLTKRDLVDLLTKSGISFDCLESGPRWMIVAPALAARIMGAGVGEENAFWVSPVLSTKGWTEGGNAGGQRTWLAPEAGPAAIFFSADGATWNVPMALDPGDYHQIPVETGGRSYRMALEVHTADGERYPIAITRSMRLEDGPIAPASCSPRTITGISSGGA